MESQMNPNSPKVILVRENLEVSHSLTSDYTRWQSRQYGILPQKQTQKPRKKNRKQKLAHAYMVN